MTDEPKQRRFAGSDFEFWLIYIAVAVFVGTVAIVDGAFVIALMCLALVVLCALFAWQAWSKPD
jgi:Flp pilus assembly protein TadB